MVLEYIIPYKDKRYKLYFIWNNSPSMKSITVDLCHIMVSKFNIQVSHFKFIFRQCLDEVNQVTISPEFVTFIYIVLSTSAIVSTHDACLVRTVKRYTSY